MAVSNEDRKCPVCNEIKPSWAFSNAGGPNCNSCNRANVTAQKERIQRSNTPKPVGGGLLGFTKINSKPKKK